MPEFKSDSINVGSLLSKDWFFRVPSYQRPFSWDEEQFDDLITDTKDADRKAPYFLGTIVLHKDSGGTAIVVDGQQRLTSLVILFACLRDAIEDVKYKDDIQETIMQEEKIIHGIPERVRIEVKDRDIFNNVVVNRGGTLLEYDLKALTEPQQRYIIAAKTFHARISTLNEAQRRELVTFLTQKCVLIYLLADSFEQAFRLFEIVNDRGKQLRRIDILKSINIAPDAIALDTVRDRVAQRWEELEKEIGESAFESVFFLIRLIVLKDKPKFDLLKEFEERIFAKSIVHKGEPFATFLFEYIKLYREIFVDKTYIDAADQYGIRYQSLIHIMDSEFQASEWRACLLAFARKFGREKFYAFCLAVEKLFLTQWVQGIRKDERYADYSRLLQFIDDGKTAEEVVNSVPFDAAAIVAGVMRTDIYHASFCKYALLRLELVTSEHDVAKKFSAKSIEHVFPQNPSVGSKWLEAAEASSLPAFVHSIGNLVLISKSRNSSAGNLDFEEKKKKYLKPRVSDYPRSVQILGYDSWGPEIVAARNQQVAKIFLEDL